MKLKVALSKFLTNKWVLNIVAVLSLLNVIGYLTMGNLNAVIFFIILAVLVRYFSKNMIIVLGVPLLLVNLLAIKGNMVEGMETQKSDEEKNEKGRDDKQKDMIKKINQQDAKSKQGLPITPIMENNAETTNTTSNDATTDESFEVGRNKKGGGNTIDYAATVEDAYDELNKILGSDGIKSLTDDTQKLMKQQMQLAEAMKGMAPIIQGMAPMMKQAQDLLGGMGDNKEGLGNIIEMAKKFTSK
jgi:hypothetical protein